MRWALAVMPLLALAVLAIYMPEEETASLYLEKSVPHVGADFVSGGPDGEGILIAVIDTGINHEHPDLAGFGPDGKVAGGHNFIDPFLPPLDTNGHGTQVAGIIAANGGIRGVAPEARLLAYKVSEDGEGVSPDLIVRALRMAVDAGADIINISLGVKQDQRRHRHGSERGGPKGGVGGGRGRKRRTRIRVHRKSGAQSAGPDGGGPRTTT